MLYLIMGAAIMKPFQAYAAKGYHVVRGAIPANQIAALADAFYSDANPSKTSLPRQNGRMEPIALEDIALTATRFFVIPSAKDFCENFDLQVVNGSNVYTDQRMTVMKERYSEDIVITGMRAGDLLFWNTRVIHGSLPGTDPMRS